MEQYSKVLLRFSAVFALIGAMLGAHMAGAGSYAVRPIHAHILVVGWLTLFAWSIYYKVFTVTMPKLAKAHVWTGIIGVLGLTGGMWVYNQQLFGLPKGVTLGLYIGGGTVLLVSFILFLITTFYLASNSNRK